jgi:hypothetical protein
MISAVNDHIRPHDNIIPDLNASCSVDPRVEIDYDILPNGNMLGRDKDRFCHEVIPAERPKGDLVKEGRTGNIFTIYAFGFSGRDFGKKWTHGSAPFFSMSQ